jgi:ketosteroid isomerase-like protein
MSAQDNMTKVEAGFKAVNERDLDTFLALLEPDFKLLLILEPAALQTQASLGGREGFKSYLDLLYSAFPDFRMEQVTISGHRNMVYQEIIIYGSHLGKFVLPTGLKIPPTGLKVRIPVEIYHSFDDTGCFKSSTGHAKLIDVLKQFGL